MASFGIGGLQIELQAGNNLSAIAAQVGAARRRLSWLDMLVLPELCAYGPSTAHAEEAGGPAEQMFCALAREHGIWLISGSHFVRTGADIHNTSLVIDPQGRVVARYRKLFPFLPYEAGVTPGAGFCVFDVPGVARFGLSICYDLWFPEVARTLAWQGAQILINPTLTNTIDRDVELSMARATAAINQCYVVNVNCAGQIGLGRSIACGPGGEVIWQAGAGHEVAGLDIDPDYVSRVRERGWNGLGQTLKSFRDNTVQFPPYQPGARSAALDGLGALAKPVSQRPRNES